MAQATWLVRLMAVLLAVHVALLAGCNTGSRNEAVVGGVPAPTDNTAPFAQSFSPQQGEAGDIITISGRNFSSDLNDIEVLFSSNGVNGAEIAGQILSVTVLSTSGGVSQTSLQVKVPTGVRSGRIEMHHKLLDGESFEAIGISPFTAAPQIVGFIVGNNNQGFVALDFVLNLVQTEMVIYGYDVSSITNASFIDAANNTVAVTVSPGSGGNTVPIPLGMQAATITFPTGGFTFTNTVNFMTLETSSSASGFGVLQANDIQVPFRGLVALGEFEDLPASISSMVVESGVQAGDIRILYSLFSDPAYELVNVQPEFFNAALGTWQDCSPADPDHNFRTTPGSSTHFSPEAALVGPGNSHTFVWDSAQDLPGFIGRVRVRIEPGVLSPSMTTQFGQAESSLIAIDNSITEGELALDFDTSQYEGDNNSAIWDKSTDMLRGSVSAGSTSYGTGTADVLLENGHTYEWSFEFGSIIDITDLAAPVVLLDLNNNPGFADNEFHVRTLTIENGVVNQIIDGDLGGLVIRCSGTGSDTDVALRIETDFIFAGTDAVDATNDLPGIPGEGGIGGFDGGAGGDIELMGSAVVNIIDGQDGGGFGGYGGASSSIFLTGQPTSSPRAGPGGGGGHATRGEDAVNTSATLPREDLGRGGPIRGSDSNLQILGGSGGGGGGSAMVKSSAAQQNPTARFGGAGGGGGGVFAAIVDGGIEINAVIDVSGGDGSRGSAGANAGAGGGGSGGSIKLQASGSISLGPNHILDARGGDKAGSGSYGSGRGADGRIRLEANGGINYPGLADFSGVQPTIAVPGISTGIAGTTLDAGDGSDGALNLFGQVGVFTLDTNTGTVTSPTGTIVLSNASGDGEFMLTRLDIPNGVTLKASGANPLILRVQTDCTIDGIIDASGEDGGMVDYSLMTNPIAGAGGLGGPAGGHGGNGGSVVGGLITHGGDGTFPPGFPDDLKFTPPLGGGGGGVIVVPTGMAMVATGGESTDVLGETAGNGGGGAHTTNGQDGSPADAESGHGGSALDDGSFSYLNSSNQLEDLFVGGSGGAGGGGTGTDGVFDHLPGSGGGGGGGYIQLVVGSVMELTDNCQILANGGNAFQTLIGSGQGGGGGAGTIRIQGDGLNIVSGLAKIEAVQGLAYQILPDPQPGATDITGSSNGSHGRIRIESRVGFTEGTVVACVEDDPLALGAICPPPTISSFATGNSFTSFAESLAIPLRSYTGANIGGIDFIGTFLNPQPVLSGANTYRVLFAGAKESADSPGSYGEFGPAVENPADLGEVDAVKMLFFLFGDPTGLQPSVDTVTAEFEVVPVAVP